MGINTTNTNFATDLRLLSNRKAIELSNIKATNEYEIRSAKIIIERKYKIVIEALEGLYEMGVEHSCSLVELINSFDSI